MIQSINQQQEHSQSKEGENQRRTRIPRGFPHETGGGFTQKHNNDSNSIVNDSNGIINDSNLNLKPEEKNNNYETDENLLWNLEIPMQIKQKIKTKIRANDLQLSANQILDIENAYHHQVDKGLIIPDCSNEDDLLNDFDFAQTLIALLDKVNVTEIKSMKAIIDNWVEKGFSYKFDKNRSVFR